VLHSRSWHACFEKIESGRCPSSPSCAARSSARLELAATAHIRVAEHPRSTPSGRQRGIFVGGAVRCGFRVCRRRRMMDMMLTGRVYSAQEGLPLGSRNLVDDGAATPRGWSCV